jgi:hypothetical protein
MAVWNLILRRSPLEPRCRPNQSKPTCFARQADRGWHCCPLALEGLLQWRLREAKHQTCGGQNAPEGVLGTLRKEIGRSATVAKCNTRAGCRWTSSLGSCDIPPRRACFDLCELVGVNVEARRRSLFVPRWAWAARRPFPLQAWRPNPHTTGVGVDGWNGLWPPLRAGAGLE